MSLKKIVLYLFVLLIGATGYAQQKEKLSRKKLAQEAAKQQITLLHNGALLVRLKTKQKSIDALNQAGKRKLAEKVKKQQDEINLQIIKAFAKNFDFCSTYFFLSDDSRFIINKQLDSLYFIGDDLKVDSTIKFNNTSFLTAEFTVIEQDTAKHFDYYESVPGKDGPEQRSSYQGGTNFGFGALIIKSDQFVQLRKPFPYYVRKLDSLPFKRKPKTVVKKMNQQLHGFYKMHGKW
ncbi:MAG: hypothetical protein CL840_11885 [Crocinitomicaceae bacterium]|nr:hypothetical protein [Crocinitomicaceae bacterium]|tara:strand:- start:163 stop:867 length:705 start_codon:yes stop_codon:yes gene_type:complete